MAKLQVNTPDVHANRMINIWNAYQILITYNFSRSASYFESGIGRGMGFRDSNQDLLGFVHMIPSKRVTVSLTWLPLVPNRRRLSPISTHDQARQP